MGNVDREKEKTWSSEIDKRREGELYEKNVVWSLLDSIAKIRENHKALCNPAKYNIY